MKLAVTRFDQGRYETAITRDDGVRYRLKGVAHEFAIPHDLAHFLVEKTLGLKSGFWDSIAGGAVFKTMDYIGGRSKPKAAERSKTLLKSNAAELNEAEVLVRIFNDTIEQGHGENSPLLRERLERPAGPARTEISPISAPPRSRAFIQPIGTCCRNGRSCRSAAGLSCTGDGRG